MKSSKLEPGDLVLVKKNHLQEKHKIADIWEEDPYEVIKQRQDGLPVFVVGNNGHEQILHCNMLFLLHYQHEIKSNIDNIGEFDNKMTLEQIQDDVHVNDPQDQPV